MVRPYGRGIFKNDKQRKAVMAKLKGKKPHFSYMGNKYKLTDKIIKTVPDKADTIYDGFAGSNVVAYEFKKQGKRVITNDKLKYSYHISRAIIENNKETLSEEEVEKLLKDKPNFPHRLEKAYAGVYFNKPVLRKIDSIRHNINNLKGYKKDIALSALGLTAIQSNGYGHFTVTNSGSVQSSEDAKKRKLGKFCTVEKFEERFKENVKKINELVFDNGRQNKAYNLATEELNPKLKVDYAYYDPPYVTKFSAHNYSDMYHFVEAIMTHLKTGTIANNKLRTYKEKNRPANLTKSNIEDKFNDWVKSSKAKRIVLSYRDKSYPEPHKIKEIFERNGYKLKERKTIKHSYNINKKAENNEAKEYLYVFDKH